MKVKVCFRCGREKPLSDFYKHKQMGDGHLNKCKDCTRSDAKARHYLRYKDEEFVESERKRSRERYHRLNYNERSKVLAADKPWKSDNLYKQLRKVAKRTYEIFDDEVLHHYNYYKINKFFIINSASHRQLHTKLELDMVSRCFF